MIDLLRRNAERASCALILTTLTLGACADPEANEVLVVLAPEVISSNDGSLHVRALVLDDRTPVTDHAVRITVDYVDRNGDTHAIDEVTGVTDGSGAIEAALTGFAWEGSGTVTVDAVDDAGTVLEGADGPISGAATFSVLDRTPPVVRILPPTSDMRIGPGLPLQVAVEVEDEIGVSEVFLEAAGELDRLRSTVVASGATQATVTFDFDVPDGALPGPTITLYALAGDLSGNQSAAEPVVLTVDPAIAVATPSGLDGDILTDGSGNFLEDPTALAVSPKDGFVYVADNSGGSPCNGACIRRVDPSDGSVLAGAVVVGNNRIEGVAFDATGDHLYFSDRQNRLSRLTFDSGTMLYGNLEACNDFGADNPQDPFHLVHDATLGILAVDDQDSRVKQQVSCNSAASPDDFTSDVFDRPWGIALGAAGEIYVSDEGDGSIVEVDRTSGNASLFASAGLDEPRGIDWLAGGSSIFADSLLVADFGDRTVSSTSGGATRDAVFLRNRPTDVAVTGTTLYVLTRPSAGDPGRVFVVTGF